MDVPKDMDAWLHLLHSFKKELAACILTFDGEVKYAKRRPVSNEDIHIGDTRPDVLLFVLRIVKSRVMIVYCMRRTKNPDAFDFDVLVLQVSTVFS